MKNNRLFAGLLFLIISAHFVVVAGSLVAAETLKPGTQKVEDRLSALETEQQITKALIEKDNEIKNVLEKEINRSSEIQKQVQTTASDTIIATKTAIQIVSIGIGVIMALLALFGFKTIKDVRIEAQNKVDEITRCMVEERQRVTTDQKEIGDIKEQIKRIHEGIKGLYEDAKAQTVKEPDLGKKTEDLSDQEKLALADVSLKFDIAEKFGIKLDASDYMKIFTKYYYEKNYNLAIKALEKAIELKPDYADAYYNWGIALNTLGKNDEAIEKYKKATELKPDHASAYSNWGFSLDELGKSDEAIEKYKKATELKPDYAIAYSNWGATLSRLGKKDEAIEKYKKAIELKPDYVEAYSNWGGVLCALRKSDEAIEKLKKAIELKPDHAGAFFNLACAYSLKKSSELCCENLKKAVALNQNYKANAKTDTDFDNVRGEECFKKLVEE